MSRCAARINVAIARPCVWANRQKRANRSQCAGRRDASAKLRSPRGHVGAQSRSRGNGAQARRDGSVDLARRDIERRPRGGRRPAVRRPVRPARLAARTLRRREHAEQSTVAGATAECRRESPRPASAVTGSIIATATAKATATTMTGIRRRVADTRSNRHRDGGGATTNASANASAAAVTALPGRVAGSSDASAPLPSPVSACQAVATPTKPLPSRRNTAISLEPALAVPVPTDVQQHLHRRRELTVQREAVEASERCQRLEPGRHLGGIVGVDGSRAAVMTGVERGQQVDHLRAAHLADDDPVRSHPQRLPHQVANGNLAYPFDIRAPCDQLHEMRMSRFQLGGVLHADDAFVGANLTKRGRQAAWSCPRRCRRRPGTPAGRR